MLLLIAKVLWQRGAMPRSISLIKFARSAKVRCDTANIFRIFFSPWLTITQMHYTQMHRDIPAVLAGVSTPIPSSYFIMLFCRGLSFAKVTYPEHTTSLVENNTGTREKT